MFQAEWARLLASINSGAYKQLPVREALVYAAVALEVCLFCGVTVVYCSSVVNSKGVTELGVLMTIVCRVSSSRLTSYGFEAVGLTKVSRCSRGSSSVR